MRECPTTGSIVTYLRPSAIPTDVVGRGVVMNDPIEDPFTGARWLPLRVAEDSYEVVPVGDVIAAWPGPWR